MTDPQPYHHANLRKTLLDAAVALIGEVGPRAFTLREVARRAGVSHNAPYRHFAGKDELLVAVAEEGFDRLTAVMQKTLAWQVTTGATPVVRLRLRKLCPALAAAFPRDVRSASSPAQALQESGYRGQCFRVLLDCITAAQQSGDLPTGDRMPLAWTAWSLVHGIAKLAISGNLPLSARSTIEFTRRASQTFSAAWLWGNAMLEHGDCKAGRSSTANLMVDRGTRSSRVWFPPSRPMRTIPSQA